MPSSIMTRNYPAAEAKRWVKRLANEFRDPESFIRQSDWRISSDHEREMTCEQISVVGDHLRKAFETPDEYQRDWFMFVARFENAAYEAPFGRRFGTAQGVVPMAEGTLIDRTVSFVQKHLADKMAICGNDKCDEPCFFRRGKQPYCSRNCAKLAKRRNNLRYYHSTGRVKRAERRKSLAR